MVRVKERVAPRAPENADDEQRFPQIQGSRRFRNPSVASLNLWEHWIIRAPAHAERRALPVLFWAYQRPLHAPRCVRIQEGHLRIARRFNVGTGIAPQPRIPKGRQNIGFPIFDSCRPLYLGLGLRKR